LVALLAAHLDGAPARRAVVLFAAPLCRSTACLPAAPPEGGGGFAHHLFFILLFVHSVFPFDGADVTICFAAERAAASTRSKVSCDTLVNL
jgi:hypothetical protein